MHQISQKRFFSILFLVVKSTVPDSKLRNKVREEVLIRIMGKTDKPHS
jgi:hypothetical protein